MHARTLAALLLFAPLTAGAEPFGPTMICAANVNLSSGTGTSDFVCRPAEGGPSITVVPAGRTLHITDILSASNLSSIVIATNANGTTLWTLSLRDYSTGGLHLQSHLPIPAGGSVLLVGASVSSTTVTMLGYVN